MVITYKTINKIQFPIYQLPSDNWHLIDGLMFIDDVLVDDRNMLGDTLGKRRLQTHRGPLLPLRKAITSLVGVIKQNGRVFIDAKGRPFIYEKTKFCKLIYHKIKKIEGKNTASLLWVHGISFPFEIPRPPAHQYEWAGVLYMEQHPWLLYEYSQSRLKNSRKKV